MNSVRNKIIDICEQDDNMKVYHITLGYKYKNISDVDIKLINKELELLNILVNNQPITLKKPNVYFFNDMTNFTPIMDIL